MAWEWSHTQEAYNNALNNLASQRKDWLQVVYAEWIAYEDGEGFNEQKYARALQDVAAKVPGHNTVPIWTKDMLVGYVWGRAYEQATCDNGGFNAWMCPYGCHTVSFEEE